MNNNGEDKYHFLFTNNPQPNWIYDLETLAFLEVNTAAINHYGYSKEEFLSMTLKDIRPTEDIPALLEHVRQIDKIYNKAGEWKHKKKNGKLIFVEIISLSIIYRGRNARLVLVHDISDSKEAKEKLIESQQQLLDIFDFLPDATFVIDNDKKIIAWNKAIEKLTGVRKEDIIGKGDHSYAIPFYGRNQNAFIDLMDSSDEELNARYKNFCREGSTMYAEIFAPALFEGKGAYISVKGAPLFNVHGERMGSIESIRDVTDRKKAEEALLKLRKAIVNSGEAIFLTDQDGIFTFVNPAFTSLYGYSSEEIVGENTPRIIKSGVLDKSVYEYFWRTLLNGDEVRGELINKRKDGTLVTIEGSSTSIIDEEKNIIGFLGIQRDISDRKKSEQELIFAKEKAEESDRLKSAFLNNISHEIRTPMNGILGFAELLKDPGFFDEDPQEYISIIEKSGVRMLNIIDEIVDISNIESGHWKVDSSIIDLSKLIEFVCAFFESEVEGKGIQLIIKENLSKEDIVLQTDQEKLYKIITNLFKNAIKFTKSGTIEFGFEVKGNYIEFFVKDTGIGISKELTEIIFERFRQGSESLNRNYEGAGLGLSISKAYVKILGGEIWLESEEEKGSTFCFTIPLIASSQKLIFKNQN